MVARGIVVVVVDFRELLFSVGFSCLQLRRMEGHIRWERHGAKTQGTIPHRRDRISTRQYC